MLLEVVKLLREGDEYCEKTEIRHGYLCACAKPDQIRNADGTNLPLPWSW